MANLLKLWKNLIYLGDLIVSRAGAVNSVLARKRQEWDK